MKKRISTIVVTAVITLIATTTVFASAYTILTFNGDMNDANRIRDITATMTAQTDQLNKTVAALQSSEGHSDFYAVYFNSMHNTVRTHQLRHHPTKTLGSSTGPVVMVR